MQFYEKFMGENATMVLSESRGSRDDEDDGFPVCREAWDKDLTTVAMLKACETAEQGQGAKYEFKPEDFIGI